MALTIGEIATGRNQGLALLPEDPKITALQRFTLTCGREERFSIAVSLLPRASIVYGNKETALNAAFHHFQQCFPPGSNSLSASRRRCSFVTSGLVDSIKPMCGR